VTQQALPQAGANDPDGLDFETGVGEIIAFAHTLGLCGCPPKTPLANCPHLRESAETIRAEEASGKVRPGVSALLDQPGRGLPPRRGPAGLFGRIRRWWQRWSTNC